MKENIFNPGPWKLPEEALSPKDSILESSIKSYQMLPNPKAADAFVGSAKHVIDAAIKSYAVTDNPAVRAKAKAMLLDSAAKYDPSKSKAKTYLMTQLQGLRRYSNQVNSSVRAPEQHMIDAGRVNKHLPDLRLELGRDPSDQELADRIGIPPSRIARARKVPTSISGDAAEDVPSYALHSTTPLADKHKAWVDFIYQDLSPTDQLILEHSIGHNKKKKLGTNEIAAKLGISAGAVSQRKKRIEDSLNQYDSFFGG